MIKTYLLILIIFVIFINIQVYFYNIKYKKNDTLIKNVESFQNTLVNIDSNEQYLLDDKSLEILLGDYNNLHLWTFKTPIFKPYNSLIFVFLFYFSHIQHLYYMLPPSFLYLSTQRIKLRVEHLNILQTSSCDVSSVNNNQPQII